MAGKKSLLRSPKFLIPAGLLLILIAAVVIFRLYNHNQVEKRLAAIRAAGYPATCAELNDWYPDVPYDENAAELILLAIDYFVNWNDKSIPNDQREIYHLEPIEEPNLNFPGMMPGMMPGMIPELQPPGFSQSPPSPDWNIKNNNLLPFIGAAELPDPPDHLSIESLAVIEDFLTDNAKALQLLHQAAAHDSARYPVNLSQGFNVLLTHLGDIRHSVKVLSMEAILLVEKNQSDQAFQSVITLFHTGGSLKSEPMLISYLVKISCDGFGYELIERLLNYKIFNTQQLQTLQTTLANIDNHTCFARALVGTRCCGNDYYLNLENYSTGLNTMAIAAMRVSGLLEVQHVTYLDLLKDFVEAANIELSQGYQQARNLQIKIDKLPFYQFIVQQDMYSCLRSFMMYTRLHTQNLLARTALAIEQFRLRHNRLPETLDELIPDLLAEIPRDPFDPNHQPLRYRQNETGYTLYSFGYDQTDNNGAKYDANGWEREPGTDLPFTVHH